MLVSCSDILSGSFVIYLGTAHNNAPNLCSNHTSANLSFSDACTTNSITWFPDTDANQHVTPDIAGMTHAKPYLDNDQLHVGDGMGLVISNTTHNILHTPKRVFMLSNVLHVPKIKKKRLFSIQQFCHENYVFFEFHSSVF